MVEWTRTWGFGFSPGRTSPRNLSPSSLFFAIWCCVTWIFANVPLGFGAGTEIFELSQLCKGQFPPQMHRKIDGAVIISKNEKNLDCSVTFAAEYVSQKFLIRFEEFHMECGDQLNVYDSANPIGNPRAELNCRYLRPEDIGEIRTRGHFVTLRFITDNWGTASRRFTVILTSYKEPAQGCQNAFFCSQDNMCISNRLLCDDVRNCQNGADELRSANCTSNFILDLFSARGDSTLGILIISGLLVISTVIVLGCVCLCQRRRLRPPRSAPDINNHAKNSNEASGSNGAGTMIAMTDKTGIHHSLSHQQHPTSSTLENLHKSGNWHLPAESLGYTMKILLHRLRSFIMGD